MAKLRLSCVRMCGRMHVCMYLVRVCGRMHVCMYLVRVCGCMYICIYLVRVLQDDDGCVCREWSGWETVTDTNTERTSVITVMVISHCTNSV